MRLFPGEAERTREIQVNLHEQFAYCDTIYKHWLEVDHDRWMAKAKLPSRVYLLLSALNIQSFRLYRSICEECRRAEAMTATILCRTLFETVVAMLFTLKPKIAVRLKIRKDRASGTVVLDSDGRPDAKAELVPLSKARKSDLLTTEFRATLYFAHAFIEQEEAAKAYATTRGLKKFSRRANRLVDLADMTAIEKEIGPEWSHVLRNYPYNYCGLSVSKLCRYVDPQLGKWYDTIYSVQCGDVHAANARRHLRFTGGVAEGEALSSDAEVLIALKAATLLFKGIIDLAEEHVGYGAGNMTALKWFDREYDRLFKGKPIR